MGTESDWPRTVLSGEDSFTVATGENPAAVASMPDHCVDRIITDPPYALGFMGKAWDTGLVSFSPAFWAECLRVAKPGAFLLAFGGTRTVHRLACAIEDAGWEIRDRIQWIYGSGFPKSLDISKAIDKAAGAEPIDLGESPNWRESKRNNQIMNPMNGANCGRITAPATDAAKLWDGWGTALKPSHEEIIIATKPLTPLLHCATMIANLTRRIESCWYSAKRAEANSTPIRANSSEAKGGSAQEPVATRSAEVLANGMGIGRAGDTSSEADTSASMSAVESTALSTLLSWRNTLAGCFDGGKTSTTSTDAETTTDWKTLSFCLSAITPADITPDGCCPSGLNANASNAARYFSAALLKLRGTQELSALGLAMPREAANSPVVGGNVDALPIIVAMKPLDGTFAANAEKWGVAGLNIDGGRVGAETRTFGGMSERKPEGAGTFRDDNWQPKTVTTTATGRWPANLIHDGSPEVMQGFPDGIPPSARQARTTDPAGATWALGRTDKQPFGFADSGSAARYFYCAKVSRAERNRGIHGFSLDLEICLCDPQNEESTVRVQSLVKAISAFVTGTATLECSTTSCGKKPTGQSLRVAVSTTSTATSKTTALETFFASTTQTTSEFIAGVIETMAGDGLSLVASAESIAQSLTTTSEKAASARGVRSVVSQTPLQISASVEPLRNVHPTIKPLALMEYLCKLTATPTGGVVLDPFMGSGTTGVACAKLGRPFIGIEQDAASYATAKARIDATDPLLATA